jgi:hypothetical protein
MEKQPAYVEISNQDGTFDVVRVMAGKPKITLHRDYDFVTGAMAMHHQRWDEVDIDIIEESDKNYMPITNWANSIRECDMGQAGFIAPLKKNLKIFFPSQETTIELYGCLITSFTQEILDDEDIISHEVFKNYNFCKREVLFEKIGHEKIRIIISLTISIDQANLIS